MDLYDALDFEMLYEKAKVEIECLRERNAELLEVLKFALSHYGHPDDDGASNFIAETIAEAEKKA